MAGAGYKLFNTGDVLTAAQVNTYLQEQTVMVFADAAARTTALSGVLAEGMITYLKSTDAVEVYNGSTWVNVASDQTPLTTKGDLFTYSTTDARLAVGNNGETLVADSSTSTGLRYQSNFAAGKNKIINGNFGIWQRGTSFNNNGGTYTADRWVITGSGTVPTVSQQTFTPGTAPVSGYEAQYYLRWDQSSAATAAQTFQQRIEDVRTFAGQTITISFWAKANSGSAAPDLRIGQNFGSGGSSGVTTDVQTGITFTSSWVRYSYSVSVPSISGKTIGAGSYLQVYLQFPTSGTWQHDYWGFQVEAGSVATAFQTATGTLAGELAACQRYYVRYDAGTSNYVPLSPLGFSTSTTNVTLTFQYPVVLRGQASAVDYANLSVYGGSGGAFISVSSLSLTRSSQMMAELAATVSGATSNNVYRLQPNNAAGYIGFSAEL